MSVSMEDLIIEILRQDCPGACPYRFGDGEMHRKKLAKKINDKLKHRVADGNEVRVLEKRVTDLEKAVQDSVVKMKGGTMTMEDLHHLETVLNKRHRSQS